MQAVRIPDADAAGYDLRWPFQRGGFNTAPYSTPQELLGDVQAIYTGVLRDELDIAVEEFKVRLCCVSFSRAGGGVDALCHRAQDYGVILLIPDLYDDVYVREMTDLLVRTMGFKQICLIQVRPRLSLSPSRLQATTDRGLLVLTGERWRDVRRRLLVCLRDRHRLAHVDHHLRRGRPRPARNSVRPRILATTRSRPDERALVAYAAWCSTLAATTSHTSS